MNRLGPRRKDLKLRVWSPWVQGREPKNHVMWNKDYKKFLVDQLRQLDDQDEEEGSSDTQNNENEAEEQD